MTTIILAVVLLLIASAAVVIRKTYFYLPVRELQRQARQGDPLARKLYSAVAYGNSLKVLLWLVAGGATAGSIYVLQRVAPAWLDIVAVILLLTLVYAWLPAGKLSNIGTRLTLLVTPAFTKILNYLHPTFSRAAIPIEKRQARARHTGIYEREDLLNLLEQQANQTDNRLDEKEMQTVQRALEFDDYKVGDVLTSRSQIKTISADETVGPILIDELHKLDAPLVLVAGKDKADIVGILPVSQLGIHSMGKVRNHMIKALNYLNEDDSLAQALQAFQATGQSMFLVVDDSQEYLGMVTIENVLAKLTGDLSTDDFDEYQDIAAVAARHEHDNDVIEESVEPEDSTEENAEEVEADEEADVEETDSTVETAEGQHIDFSDGTKEEETEEAESDAAETEEDSDDEELAPSISSEAELATETAEAETTEVGTEKVDASDDEDFESIEVEHDS